MAIPSDQGPARLQARGLVVDTVALLRWPGTQCDVTVDEHPAGLETSAVTVDAVQGELVVESMADSLAVTGTLEVVWHGDCRRCLEPTSGTTQVDLREIFEKRPVEGETYPLGDDTVDLGPMVFEQVLLDLPLAPLCGEDCAGPAPETFPTSVEADPDDDVEPQGDPRWAALDALVFDEGADDDEEPPK